MRVPQFHKLLTCAALCLAAAGLSSCIYSDLGRTIGSVGTEVPRLVPKAEREDKVSYCGNLYRKAGRYYVGMPLAWVPERRRCYEVFPLFSPIGTSLFLSSVTYNRPYTAEELQHYPTTPEYYEAVNPIIVPFPQPDAHGAVGYVRAELTPVKDFDPQGAESLGLHGVAGAAHRIGHLEKRHAWYYYPLMPLQAVARVADVPLSVVLMPLSFPVFLCEEMSVDGCPAIQPWHDCSRLTFDGSLYPEYDTGFSPPQTLDGKRLILGGKHFNFPCDDFQRNKARGKKYLYQYRGYRSAVLTEYQLDNKLSRRWELFFLTPDSGVAVFLPQDMAARDCIKGKLPPLKPGDMLVRPFRIEKLSYQKSPSTPELGRGK